MRNQCKADAEPLNINFWGRLQWLPDWTRAAWALSDGIIRTLGG